MILCPYSFDLSWCHDGLLASRKAEGEVKANRLFPLKSAQPIAHALSAHTPLARMWPRSQGRLENLVQLLDKETTNTGDSFLTDRAVGK